jgi:hypothetical protein
LIGTHFPHIPLFLFELAHGSAPATAGYTPIDAQPTDSAEDDDDENIFNDDAQIASTIRVE